MARHVVATLDELPPGGRKRIEIGGREIALFRLGDSFFAIQDRCPHQGASLCAGRIGGLALSDAPGEYRIERKGELIRCPWHAWEFDIRTGESWCDPDNTRVRSFATNVAQGAALLKGPYVAETYDVSVSHAYVLVDIEAPGWVDAVVTRRDDLSDTVSAFVVQRADGQGFARFDAGAHVDVEVLAGLVRQYSIVSSPEDCQSYRIAVAKESSSRGGSVEIHAAWQPGTKLRVSAPRNHFRMSRRAARTILIGGGIGITPLIQMAAVLELTGAEFELHYLAKSKAEAAFLDELSGAPFASRLVTHFSNASGPSGRLDVDALISANSDAEFYVCGPGRLLEAVAERHLKLRLNPAHLHIEHFAADVSHDGEPFQIEAARSGVTLEVAANRSIAETLIEHGIQVSLSCEQGVCGTCMVPVLAGVPEHRDQVQSASDKARNWRIATCCSRSLSNKLVLDI